MIVGGGGVGLDPGVGTGIDRRTKALTLDVIIAYPTSTVFYSNDLIINLIQSITHTQDVVLLNRYHDAYLMSVNLRVPSVTYDCSVRIVLAPDQRYPQDSVINVMRESWAEQLDVVFQRMQGMAWAMKLTTSTGSELDEWWGDVYNLKRLSGESDSDYRDRLINYSTVLTGCGTKATCSTVIDNITGEVGTSSVVTYYPAFVRIKFTTADSMRIANTRLALLNSIIPNMLAEGISYQLYITYKDYLMDIRTIGTIELPYVMDILHQVTGLTETYDMDLMNVFTRSSTVALDIISKIYRTKTYDMFGPYVLFNRSIPYVNDILTLETFSVQYTLDTLTLKHVLKPHFMDGLLLKTVRRTSLIDMMCSRPRRSYYGLGIGIHGVA